MENNCKNGNAEILENIIFHLNQVRKLFDDLKYARVTALEQREWENGIKLCKDAIQFINEKVDGMGKIVT